MTEIILSEKTVEDHARIIRRNFESVGIAIFETLQAIRNANDDLGENLFQNEMAKKVGMNPPTLNRWLQIATSPLISNQSSKSLPSSFRALLQTARLEKSYIKEYPDNGADRVLKLLESGRISASSTGKDIQVLQDVLQKRITKKKKRIREREILSLSQGSLPTKSNCYTIDQARKEKLRFRGFLIQPTSALLRKWKDDFVDEFQISDEYPLHLLRSPSMNVTNIALVIVPIKDIATGLKILRAFGFNYRDTFIPNSGYSDMILMSKEVVVLRGERGKTQKLKSSYAPSDSLDDLSEWISENYKGPHCSVFVETEHPEFSAII